MLTSTETLLASAYQMTGKVKKAKTVLQVGVYQYMLGLIELLRSYLTLCTDDAETFNEIYRRTLVVTEAFDMEELHPTVLMTFYYPAFSALVGEARFQNIVERLKRHFKEG